MSNLVEKITDKLQGNNENEGKEQNRKSGYNTQSESVNYGKKDVPVHEVHVTTYKEYDQRLMDGQQGFDAPKKSRNVNMSSSHEPQSTMQQGEDLSTSKYKTSQPQGNKDDLNSQSLASNLPVATHQTAYSSNANQHSEKSHSANGPPPESFKFAGGL